MDLAYSDVRREKISMDEAG
jgi:hypothetical protein